MSFVLHWPQITYLCLTAIGLLATVAQWNRPKKADKYDAGDVLATLFIAWLLWCGGFFGP